MKEKEKRKKVRKNVLFHILIFNIPLQRYTHR